jgi:hypothetical protein
VGRQRKRYKNKTGPSSGAFIVFALVLMAGITGLPDDSGGDDPPAPDTCGDGVDNDGDMVADILDSECDPMSGDYDGNENGIIGS